jgi:hypothetical protein
MTSRKKIAAISWLIGGLAVTGAGITHAYADGDRGECRRDSQGNTTCVYKNQTSYTSEDGSTHVEQTTDCNSKSRDNEDEAQASDSGTTETGSTVSCANIHP